MTTLIDIVLRILATYRVARMVAYEDGPMDALVSLRTWAERYPHLAKGLNCPLCASFWLALAAAVAPRWVVHWLGIAGAAAIAHQITDGIDE